MLKETLAERNDRYIREGRAVSGGKDGNGPGKPGYKLVKLGGVKAEDEAAINALTDEGYELAPAQPLVLGPFYYLLFENYKKD
jgi:hypothetical protein